MKILWNSFDLEHCYHHISFYKSIFYCFTSIGIFTCIYSKIFQLMKRDRDESLANIVRNKIFTLFNLSFFVNLWVPLLIQSKQNHHIYQLLVFLKGLLSVYTRACSGQQKVWFKRHSPPALFVGSYKVNNIDPFPIVHMVWRRCKFLAVDYLTVKPVPGLDLKMDVSYQNYWKFERKSLDVGHRGMGSSYKHKK